MIKAKITKIKRTNIKKKNPHIIKINNIFKLNLEKLKMCFYFYF